MSKELKHRRDDKKKAKLSLKEKRARKHEKHQQNRPQPLIEERTDFQ